MGYFRNDMDVTSQVRTTDPVAVNSEIDRIFLELYPKGSTEALDRAFGDADRMFRGEHPDMQACSTAYHDIQHTLDVTLAMARLIDGYERSKLCAGPLGDKLFQLGVLTALFHDIGYLVRREEGTERNGAEFTIVHVSRGSHFLREYLPRLGMADLAPIAADLIHFTGYERPVASIEMPSLEFKLLGYMLGSADIIAQMSDRCYLEKCRDRLYPEFLAGGIARRRQPDGSEQVLYASGDDLVQKTPNFFSGANRRLTQDLGSVYNFAERHFGGQNVYLEEVNKNINFAREIAGEQDASILKRKPPETLLKTGTDG